MYLLEDMVDLGLEEGETWASDAHRVVAQNVLLNNERIADRTTLTECVEIINRIPADRIKLVTAYDLRSLGIPLSAAYHLISCL